MNRKRIGWGLGIATLVVVLAFMTFVPMIGAQPAGAQPAPGSAMGPKYTIVETDGTNLLVVDNSTNMVHFYTVEPGKDVGEDLHLRGSLDLNQVGKPVLTPKKAK